MSSEKTKLKFLKVMSTKNIPEANKLSWEKIDMKMLNMHDWASNIVYFVAEWHFSSIFWPHSNTEHDLPCSATICLFLPRVRITQNWAELSNKFLLSCLFEYFKCTYNTWDFSLRTFQYKERIVDNVYR